jgi:hypothetical protein
MTLINMFKFCYQLSNCQSMNESAFLYGMLHELKASPLHNTVSSVNINKVLEKSLQTCSFIANRHVKSVMQ